MARSTLARGEFSSARVRTVDRTRSSAALVLGVVAVVALVVRFLLARRIESPWIMSDELIYAELAKSFGETRELLFREGPLEFRSLLYPAVIAPAWLAGSMETTYAVAKAINVLLMTLAAIPVYLWSRRLVSDGYALLAAVLTLLMPAYLYTGMLMTENAFLPAFLTAAYAVALALERPTILRQVLALAAIAVACAVRLQGLVLFAIVPTAILLHLLLELRAGGGAIRGRAVLDGLRRYLPAVGALVVVVLAYVLLQVVQGGSLTEGLGAYRSIAEADYDLAVVARWTVYHLAELGLSVALVPVSALIVLLGLALRGGSATPAERAFLAVATASVVWIVPQVAFYASRFSSRVEERYLFCVAPLLLIALVVWLARGLPRPPALTAAAALVPVGLLTALPLGGLLNISALSDTFALIPLLRLTQILRGGLESVEVLLALAAIGAALLFVALPRRFALAIPAAIAVFFLLTTYSAFGAIRDYSRNLLGAAGGTENRSWVDERIGGEEAIFLFGTSPDHGQEASVLWQTELWNEQLGDVYHLDGAVEPLPGAAGSVDRATGRIVPLPGQPAVADDRYAVVWSSTTLAGQALAAHGPLTLYRVSPPLRLASSVEGVYADGWTAPAAALNQYSGRSSRVRIRLTRPGAPGTATATVRIGPSTLVGGALRIGRVTAERTRQLSGASGATLVLPTPPPPFRVEIAVSPPFVPSQLGLPDPRQLGAKLEYELLPGES